MPDTGLSKAITAVEGNISRLARLVGVTPQAIYQWERVPVERVLSVEAATGVSRYELRPDIYGPPPGAAGVLGDGSQKDRDTAIGAAAGSASSEGEQLIDEARADIAEQRGKAA